MVHEATRSTSRSRSSADGSRIRSSEQALTLHSVSSGNLESLWHMLLADGPSDELEADSFHDDSQLIVERKSIDNSYCESLTPSQVSQMKKVHWQHPIQKTRNFQADEGPTAGIKDENYCGGGSASKLFDMLHRNSCNFEPMSPLPSLRKIEQHVENRLSELEHPTIWSMLNPKAGGRFRRGLASPGNDGDCSFDFVPDENDAALLEVDILSDLKGSIAAMRLCDNPEAKYKRMLKGNKTLTKRKQAAGGQGRLASTPRKTNVSSDNVAIANADKRSRNEVVSEKLIDIPQSLEVLFKEETKKTDGPLMPMDTGVSSMTDDTGHTFSDPFDPFKDENLSKSCFSPNFLKKINLNESTSTASTSRMTAESQHVVRDLPISGTPEVAGSPAPDGMNNARDEESSNHAYIAYFRRGDTARNSLRLYEHHRPSKFPTLPSEVVVRIESSTVSNADCSVRRGDWWGEASRQSLNLPLIPGVAFAGTLVQIDRSAVRSGLKLGDRVISLVQVGANARHICLAKDRVVKVPSEMTNLASAACLPEVYLAAFQMLHLGQKNAARYRKASLQGKSVLILGGATAQGRALIELAKAAGSGTIYATGRECHFDAIEALGGLPINKDPHHWFSILEGRMDVVISTEAARYGKADLGYEHVKTLTNSGSIVLIVDPEEDDKAAIALDHLTESMAVGSSRKMYHYNVFDSWDSDLKLAKRDLSYLLKLLEEGSIKPKVLDRIPLNKVARAQDMIDTKKVHGFIICEPWVNGKKKAPYLKEGKLYTESASKSSIEGVETDKNVVLRKDQDAGKDQNSIALPCFS